MNTIQPSEILRYLPQDPFTQIDIRFPTGALAGTMDRDQIMHLAAENAISAVLDKHGRRIRYCTALISIKAIHRMVRQRAICTGIVAEDCRTVNYAPSVGYSHNLQRSYAYAR